MFGFPKRLEGEGSLLLKAAVSADSIEVCLCTPREAWGSYCCWSSSLYTNCYYFLDKMRGDYTYLPMSMLDFLDPIAELLVMLDFLEVIFPSSVPVLGDYARSMHSYCTEYLSDSNCPYCSRNSSTAINPPPTLTTKR